MPKKDREEVLRVQEFEAILRGLLSKTEVEIVNATKTLKQSDSGRFGDAGDASVGSFISDQTAVFCQGKMKYRESILSALERIRNGTYGICKGDCGMPIPVKRLRAYPTTFECVSCKEKREAQKSSKPRSANHTGKGKTYGSPTRG